MAAKFASGKKSYAFCDRCGQRCDLKLLSHTYILGRRLNTKVCPSCRDQNNGDHPQLWVGIIGAQKVANDPQALREPRPDTNRDESCSYFAYNPVASQKLSLTLNNVYVTEFSSRGV